MAGRPVLLADAEHREQVFERVAATGEPAGVDAAVVGQRRGWRPRLRNTLTTSSPLTIPGLIDTALTRHEERYAQVLEDAGRKPTGTAEDEQAAREILAGKTPLGVPWIEPEDVAPVVVFLASEAGRMASGSTFEITGGDSAHNTA